MNKVVKFISCILICEGVGILGSIFTIPAITTWYLHLNKPFFSPPNFVFGPVWTLLYFLLGISLYLILEKKLKTEKNKLLTMFGAQLFLNFTWSVIFFGFHLPALAFIDIFFLWISIMLLIFNFWKFSRPASLMLLPYLLWVSFASVLNLSVVVLNP